MGGIVRDAGLSADQFQKLLSPKLPQPGFSQILKKFNPKDIHNILIIPDFGEDFDTLPKRPKCKDYAAGYHDI